MGRPKHHKSRSNNRRNNQGDDINVKKSNQRWDALPETNAAFVEYYKNQQKIVSTEEEWNQLFTSFRTDLPTTFRVTGGKKNATQLNKIIEETYVPFLSNIRINEELIPPPQKISWYPNGYAWEFRAPKQLIRKSLELKKFQNFLVYETEAGNISRQEAVSMIPPLLLDVQSHHYVLDACAAPGSKTAQLVESLHHSAPGLFPKGLIIANDSDYKRSYLLVHQSLRRLPSPSTMVTNVDASRFPTLSMNGKKLLFDRILCDVPCSGDGTLRKNGGIWRDWTPANGIGLHGLQLRILSRMISLLKPGGRIVYSTCSLNPLENEAVVSAALSQFPSMSLKDVSSCLPTLNRRPGMTSWTVTTRDPNNIQPISSPNDLPDLPSNRKYPPTLWPSGREAELGLQNCLRIYPHLQDTGGFFVAVLEKSVSAGSAPPLQDIAKTSSTPNASSIKVQESSAKGVSDNEASEPTTIQGGPHQPEVIDPPVEIQEETKQSKRDISKTDDENDSVDHPESKKAKLDLEPDSHSSVPPTTDNATAAHSPPSKSASTKNVESKTTEKEDPPDNPFKEDPHVYLKPGNEEVRKCIDYYDIDPSFPVDNLLVRNAQGVPTRTIYLTSSVVREVIENNSVGRLRLICCGVKIFGRQEPSAASTTNANGKPGTVNCKWRIVSDGIEYFRPFMGPKRIVRCHINALKQLIMSEQQYPLVEDLEDSELKEQARKLEIGSCVAEIFGDKDQQNVPLDLMVGLWISKSSINLMVDKKERQVLSLRLWGEDLTARKNNPKIEKTNQPQKTAPELKNDDRENQEKTSVEQVIVEDIKPEIKEDKSHVEQVKLEETKPQMNEDKIQVKLEETKPQINEHKTQVKHEETEPRIHPDKTPDKQELEETKLPVNVDNIQVKEEIKPQTNDDKNQKLVQGEDTKPQIN